MLKNKNALIVITLLAAMLILLSACAAGPNPSQNIADTHGKVANFWTGLWHGFIAPYTLIISIFFKNIGFYDVFNNGVWYNLGYLLGLGLTFGSGAIARYSDHKN